ncbi:MAG: Hsp20/alpha crystallin family protein [Microcoleaceae cyanobacterium]
MNTAPRSKNVSKKSREKSSSSSPDTSRESTLWIGNTQETPITAITIHEMETKFVLKVGIYDIHLLKNLSLQITPETVLIQGEPTEQMVVEGYFRPSGFESLIPLPQPVQPETCLAHIEPDVLTIQLVKELRVEPSPVWIQLPTANLSDCSNVHREQSSIR